MKSRLVSPAAAPRHWRLRPLALSLACIGMGHGAWAQIAPPAGFPQNGNVVAGTIAGWQHTGATNTLDINQASLRAIINWDAFSLAGGNTVNFNHAMGAASVTLNRVVNGGPPSQIFGAINALGHVYIVNPAGVLFGAGSQVNVGGLVASTLDIAGADDAERYAAFMGGTQSLSFGGGVNDANSTARVLVQPDAVIQVGEGGTVALIGALVRNEGQINVARGSVGLVSGATVTLDFDGDGLTQFTVPVEGGLMNTSVAAVQADTSGTPEEAELNKSTKALVMNTGAITADGGRVVLVGASGLAQQVVNHSGTIRARSLVNRSGEIVLEAIGASVESGAGLAVSGALDARGDAAGVQGGSIRTAAGHLSVAAGTDINADGGEGGANGSWTAEAGRDLLIAADADVSDITISAIAAGTIGKALSRGTDVTLTTRSSSDGPGMDDVVAFLPGAEVIKDDGGTATLRVNSVGNIDMLWDGEGEGAAITSTSGALNVEFNADAQELVAMQAGQADAAAAAIRLNNATIDANGGDIRFFGQGDVDKGSAIGGLVARLDADASGEMRSGVWLGNSTLRTADTGSISLRGEGGISISPMDSSSLSASHGVSINDSTLRTQAGRIDVTGESRPSGTGVAVQGDYNPDLDVYATLISSDSGDLTLTGTTRDWNSSSDPVGSPVQASSSDGVLIAGAELATGGNVRIDGTGGDLSGLQALAASMSLTYTIDASDGVVIDGARIEAGQGRRIDITGTAGSAGASFDGTTWSAGAQALGVQVEAWRASSDGLRAAGGSIDIAAGSGDVRFSSAIDGVPLLDATSATGQGGDISVTGRNILAQWSSEGSADDVLFADASGATGGGSIFIRGATAAEQPDSGVVAFDPEFTLRANALDSGDGGSIHVTGERSLRAFGRFEARGGSAGGNGGTIETSGGSFDLRGVRVDASAPAGQAGSWLIDPYDVTIQNGVASGSLPTNPFEPVATSVIQDGDINAALDTGTSVTITTGTGGTDAGNINFDSGVVIERTTGAAPVTFQLDAANSIGRTFVTGWEAPTIRSTTGPMDVVFNAGGGSGFGSINFSGASAADLATITTQGGSVSMQVAGTGSQLNVANAAIDTGGGSVTLQAGTPGSTGEYASVNLHGQVNTGGGAVSVAAYGDSAFASTGLGTQIVTDGGALSFFTGQPGAPAGSLGLNETLIDTRAGQSDAGAGGAVSIASGSVNIWGSTIAAATGDVHIIGAGDLSSSGSGVILSEGFSSGDTTRISTTSGDVTVEGVARANPSSAFSASHGVLVGGGSSISSGSGSIALRGSFDGNVYDGTDSGVRLEFGASVVTTGGGSIELTGSSSQASAGVSIQPGTDSERVGLPPVVHSSGDLILRAASDGSVPALMIDVPVSAAGAINLRPGGMDTARNTFDATGTEITVGGAAGPGFTVSDALLAQLNAPTVVVGSNTHEATITVAGPLTTGGALTLQNEGQGEGAGGIALNAGITADRLGLLSAGDITQTASAPIVAQHLLARSTGGSVLLDQAANNVSENTLGGGAAGAFRYQDVDGVRLGALSVTGFDAGTNQSQVVSATSMAADTVFVRTLSGDLTLDTAISSSSGVDLVAAARFQNPGGGSISGAPWRIWADTWEGESRGGLAGSGPAPDIYGCPYPGPCAGGITPGDNHFIYARQRLTPEVVTWRLPTIPLPDLLREIPNTYTFDRNIGALPICFATGPLNGDRAQQGDDLLAREWSRVRARPNLTSCVDTERKNGCSDF